MLLGRAGAGTLRMSVDQRGLKYEIDLPETSVGQDVAASIARGDLTGSSFAFRINGKQGQRFEKGSGYDVRNILDVDLFDVGPVTYPAYEGTTTGLRSGEGEDAIAAHDAWQQEQGRMARERRLKIISLDE
jgi:HK97 family phage prohead protease